MSTSIRAMELAIAHGDTKEVTDLLDAAPGLRDIHFQDNIGLTPLMWACRHRHVTIVELLLKRGASVQPVNRIEADGEGGNSALWFTAQGSAPGTISIARLLVDHGAEINFRGQHGTTPFYMAVVWVHMELVQFLLAHGANPLLADAQGKTPLQAVRESQEWLKGEQKITEDMKRLGYRAPRMIDFLEKLTGNKTATERGN